MIILGDKTRFGDRWEEIGFPCTNNKFKVGMDLGYPPFETVDENNKTSGISFDIELALGEFIGREIEIVNTLSLTKVITLQKIVISNFMLITNAKEKK